MGTAAILKNIGMSSQKARLVADEIRGKPVERALDFLKFTEKKAARIIKKVLESAIANAEHNDGEDIDDLTVSEVCVDKAPALRRFQARAKGRANRIVKHRCHIRIVVSNAAELQAQRG